MFKPELKNETIALGAIYQASNEIKKIAWEGDVTNNIIQPLIHSIYQTTSEDIEDDRYTITLYEEERGIAKGQAAVIYNGTECIGGGTVISKCLSQN